MILRQTLQQTTRFLANAVFPPRCGCCGELAESQGRLCATCWSGLTFIAKPYCAACGYPFAYLQAEEEAALCGVCMQYKPHYDGHRAMLHFDGLSKKLVHDLKYHDKPLLLPLFGEWLARAGAEWLDDKATEIIIIPVPLHFLRLWKRRYNQSALLARSLAKYTEKTVLIDGLVRVKRVPPQAGLSREQRLKNMRGVFAVNPKRSEYLHGKTVVLVDDVMTTGATINACAKVLKKSGVAAVYAVTLARTVLGD